MKHNQHNPEFQFVREPESFNKDTANEFLQFCLGATLYMPGTKQVTAKILTRGMSDVGSMVMCLEDAVAESDLPDAESNIRRHLDALHTAVTAGTLSIDDIPLTFVRIRNTEQFAAFAKEISAAQARMLSGFVFPKFYSSNARAYLDCLEELNARHGVSLYGMPILEGRAIAHLESRNQELVAVKAILDAYKDRILNVRVGGTDFSSIFGVRRDINTSIYNIVVVRDCLGDILNFFNRETDGYTVSGAVWEYFLAHKQDDINTLLKDDTHTALFRRRLIVNEAIDGLLREVIMDRANGFVGKTIIHPSHLRFVNGMQAVTREEYEDAVQISETSGGVVKSASGNKMNEINPHRAWARRTIMRARAFGVVESERDYLRLILGRSFEQWKAEGASDFV